MNWKDETLKLWNENKTQTQIATIIRNKYFPQMEIEKVRQNKIRTQLKPFKKQSEGDSITDYNADGSIVSTKFLKLQSGKELTPDELLKLHGLDAEKWEVAHCTNNFWNSQLKGGILQISYQSKLTAKPKKTLISFSDIDKHFKQLDRQYIKPQIKRIKDGELTAEINIADLHLGKLCWHGDTGINYDHKIAKRIFLDIINELCFKLKDRDIKKILFVWTNDFFNSDNEAQTTTAGTPQDTDIRAKKLFNIGVELLVTSIDLLSDIAPVETFYTPSNHDEETSYSAIKYLEAWFRQNKNITIDTNAKPRKYMLIGNTLVGFTHGSKENSNGNKEKASRLASVMPIEASELWAKAKFREMHTAHLHSEHMIAEINGVIVRRISAPTATDTWHCEHGFIGAVRKAQTFIYDDERGILEVIHTPVRSA